MHEQRDFLGSTIAAAREFSIAHEVLAASAVAERFPQFALTGDEVGYYEPGAGYLVPEACVSAQLELAARFGAVLKTGESVRAIRQSNRTTVVDTDRATYTPGTTVIAAGPWLPALMPALSPRLKVRRQVLYWFELADGMSIKPDQCPIFIWHWGAGPDDVFYGFPEIANSDGSGLHSIKIATEQCDTVTTPDTVDRNVSPAEISKMFATHIAGRIPTVTARCVKASTCLYTNLPGANFLIDRLPDQPDVIVVSACSGHGFKHSAAIGEAVATMALSGATPALLKPFAFATS
jgi:sarcosine oxidase